jgi:hypothetical protein
VLGSHESGDVFEVLRLVVYAFEKMKEINEFLSKYKAPMLLDYSSVYLNCLDLPTRYAEIKWKVAFEGNEGDIVIVFDRANICWFKVHNEKQNVDSWDKIYEKIGEYCEFMKDEWYEIAEKEQKNRLQDWMKQLSFRYLKACLLSNLKKLNWKTE